MKRKEFIFAGIILCFIIGLFFNKFFINGSVAFPGDLLINQYSPWKYESYLGYNPGSYPTKFQYFDVIRQLYPWKILAIEQFKSGQVPLWNPYNFAGTPLLANFQSQVFAPFNILYFIFPYIYGFNIGLMLQIVLAFIFTYFYTRKIKFGNEGAILAGIAFSCSLYISAFFQYGVFGQTILWLPLILLGIEGIVNQFSIKHVLFVVIGIVFAAFGGHLQVFSYVFIFSLIYGIVRFLVGERIKLKKIMLLIFLFCISLGIASIQLFPSFELINLSARSAFHSIFFLENDLLKINELVLLLSPDFYGNPATNNFFLNRSYPQTAMYVGMIPLIFAVSALFLKKNNTLKFYIATIAIILLSITNNPISAFIYSLQLPFISSSSPTNSIFIISFSLSILAGYGFDQWINKKNRFPLLVSLIIVILLVVAYGLNILFKIEFSAKNAFYSFIILSGFFIILFLSKRFNYIKIFSTILIVLAVFDLFYFFQKFNPFVPPQLAFPDAKIINLIKDKAGIDRVWGYGNANISANVNSLFKFFSPDGYDPLYPKQYGEFIYASRNGKLFKTFDVATRSDAVIDSSLGFIPENKDAQKILNLLGVRYVIDRVENGASEKIFPSGIFKLAYDQQGWKLYENERAVKRAFLTSDYTLYNSDSEFEKNFFSESFNPSQTVLLDSKPSLQPQKNDPTGDDISLRNYEESSVIFDVTANARKLLFLSDMYYPGWKAYIDGEETAILRTDYTFRSVVVPKGKHEVEFRYQPASFQHGIFGTLISLIILFIVSGILYVRKSSYED